MCPRCDDVVADVVYVPWIGRLTITTMDGDQITPSGWALQLRLVEQALASACLDNRAEAQARFDFVSRNVGEVIYDIRCQRGHSTLRTVRQVTQALRRTPGRWVNLACLFLLSALTRRSFRAPRPRV
jgi:hypothetical protein